jgi:hypothetical protein
MDRSSRFSACLTHITLCSIGDYSARRVQLPVFYQRRAELCKTPFSSFSGRGRRLHQNRIGCVLLALVINHAYNIFGVEGDLPREDLVHAAVGPRLFLVEDQCIGYTISGRHLRPTYHGLILLFELRFSILFESGYSSSHLE